MKITTDSVESFQLGVKETAKAKISANAKAFEILSSTLYSNAILAIVRELCANAKDSHTAAGIPDTQFNVQIPNELDPSFKVRDFGTGMTHEFVMNHLNTYFDSTKNESDDEIGGFGLGIKCPFSYTSSFIISCYDGTNRRVYSYQIGSDGLPEIVFMAETPSTEAKGVEVSVPAKKADYEAFIYAAAQSIAFYDVKPKMRGMQEDLLNLEKLYEGTDWAVYKNNKFLTDSEYVEMGGVVYPVVNDDEMPPHMLQNMLRSGYTAHQAKMMFIQQNRMHHFQHGRGYDEMYSGNVVMVFKANIGDVNITPNREQLKMTPHTKAFIKAAKDRLRKEVKKSVQVKLDACTGTYWEVLEKEYNDIVRSDHFLRTCNINVEEFTYQGFKLGRQVIEFGSIKGTDSTVFQCYSYYDRDHSYQPVRGDKFTINTHYYRPNCKYVILPTGMTKSIPAAHFYKVVGVEKTTDIQIFVIETDKMDEIKKLFAKNVPDYEAILHIPDVNDVKEAVKDLKVYRRLDFNDRNGYWHGNEGKEVLYTDGDFNVGDTVVYTNATDYKLSQLNTFISSAMQYDAEARDVIKKYNLDVINVFDDNVTKVVAATGATMVNLKDIMDNVVKDIATEYAKKVTGMSLDEFIRPLQLKRKDICSETFIKAVKRWARECDRDDVRQMILAMEKDQGGHYMRRMAAPFKEMANLGIEEYIAKHKIKRGTVITNQFVVDLDTHAPLAGMLVRSYSQAEVCQYVKKEMAALAAAAKKKKPAAKKKAAD